MPHTPRRHVHLRKIIYKWFWVVGHKTTPTLHAYEVIEGEPLMNKIGTKNKVDGCLR